MKVGDLVRTKKMYIIMVTGNPSQTNKTLTQNAQKNRRLRHRKLQQRC